MNPALHSFAHVLGWTLLHLCWQASLIALLLACILYLLAGRPPQARYIASCVAMLLVLGVFAVTFHRIAISALSDGQNVVANTTIEVSGSAAHDAALFPLEQFQQVLERAIPYLLPLWGSGVLLFLLRLNVGLLVARRMALSASLAVARDQGELFQSVVRRLGVSRPVRLLRSASVQVPVVIGWLRPVVLLPLNSLAGLSTTQIEAIFAHEIAHIRRHDYLVGVLQSIVEALLFYHPAVWWISRQIRKERELCCDDAAVQVTGSAVTYAQALYLLAERRLTAPAVTLSTHGGFLTMRIKRLLHRHDPVQPTAAVSALALMLIATGIGFHTVQAQRLSPTSTSQAALRIAEVAGKHSFISTIPVDAPPLLLAKVAPPAQPELHPVELSSLAASAVEEDKPKPRAVSPGAMAGNILTKVAPEYPAEARAAGVQGAVVLKAVISKEGDVKELQVVSGPEQLYKSATDAVRQWKYKPYLLNGQPTEVETTITVNYSIGR